MITKLVRAVTAAMRPAPSATTDSCALIVSALVPYKRVDLAIDACQLAGIPLTIVGDGPEREALERRAGPTVTFAGRRSDSEVRDLYRGAGVVRA